MRNRFGFTQSEFQVLQEIVIEPFKSLENKIWIFGSRVKGNYKKFSDVDILIEKKNEASSDLLIIIKEKIEESRFPYIVDFVFLENLAESYKSNILIEKVEL